MPSVYRDADRVRAFLEARAAGAQYLEDRSADVLLSTSIDVAEEDALDQWGRVLDIGRASLPDRIFRYLVKGKLLAAQGAITTENIDKLYGLVTNADDTEVWTHPGAGVRLEAYREDWMRDSWARGVKRLMQVARPTGVRLSLVESIPGRLVLDDDASSGFGSLLSRTL